jgi:hypothetical protein
MKRALIGGLTVVVAAAVWSLHRWLTTVGWVENFGVDQTRVYVITGWEMLPHLWPMILLGISAGAGIVLALLLPSLRRYAATENHCRLEREDLREELEAANTRALAAEERIQATMDYAMEAVELDRRSATRTESDAIETLKRTEQQVRQLQETLAQTEQALASATHRADNAAAAFQRMKRKSKQRSVDNCPAHTPR